MAPFMAREIGPGDAATSDADLDAYIRATSITVHHPLGTCKMGVASDRMAVVDAELRVFGTEGLRVVDGAVMPDLVGAHINAPIIMIAEKAADLIRGRQPLEAARIAGACGIFAARAAIGKPCNPGTGFTILSRLPIN